MSHLTPSGQQSPFDSIQLPGELWSARDLMPILGYDKWQNFEDAIDRAKASIEAQKIPLSSHVTDASKLVDRPQGGSIQRGDFHLSRFACYLIAMNGDPRKPEIAAAQAYFAIKTREAEVATTESDDEVIHRALTITAKRVEALTAKVAELEPKAEFFDNLMDANGLYSMEATAKSLGYGRNVLYRDLRRLGILQGNNLPYQRHAHHFKVIPGTYTNRKTGELVPTATTWVRPSGLDYLRRKLAEAVEAVQLSIGADA
jgi:DNA-damage-inducible protein D